MNEWQQEEGTRTLFNFQLVKFENERESLYNETVKPN